MADTSRNFIEKNNCNNNVNFIFNPDPDKHPCPQLDSNPRSQQPSGRRLTR
jgi:hypothetical protein